MRHLTILVDMDDTIENLAEAWVAYLNARHQTSTNLSDITDWDISKAFPTLTKEQVYAGGYGTYRRTCSGWRPSVPIRAC